MSLRIRRGTEAQRTGATFDLGEIVWTTDTNKLFVGDGVNAGGKNILATSAGTGLIWNATTQRLDFNGSGTGIVNVQADANPSLGGNLNLNNRNITGTGNINITGTITASQFVGVTIPAALTQNLSLNTRSITGTGSIGITGTISNGPLTLDTNVIKSTTLPATAPGYQTNYTVSIGNTANPTSLAITSTASFGVLTGLTNGTETSSLVTKISRGTLASPTTVVAGDGISLSSAFGYDGSTFVNAGGFGIAVDPAGTVSSGNVPGTFAVYTMKSGIPSFLTFNSNGVLSAPILQTGNTYTTSPDTRPGVILRQAGMIIFETTTHTFQGWNGTAWVTLG